MGPFDAGQAWVLGAAVVYAAAFFRRSPPWVGAGVVRALAFSVCDLHLSQPNSAGFPCHVVYLLLLNILEILLLSRLFCPSMPSLGLMLISSSSIFQLKQF